MFKVSVTYNSAEGFKKESITTTRESDARNVYQQLLDKYYQDCGM